MRKHLILISICLVLTGAIAFQIVKVNKEFETKLNRIKADGIKLEQLRLQEQKAKEAQQKEAENARNAEIQKQIEDLKSRVEAKKQSTIAKKVVPTVQAAVPSVGGSKADWMRAAGIPESHWSYVDSIVSRESGWNPNAINRSSGACGLGQQLPCGKWAGAWNDPVAALRAMTGYVSSRYGGWAGAVAFWNLHHWY